MCILTTSAMAGTRLANKSMPRSRRVVATLVGALVALALIAPVARASNPAGGEYQLHFPGGGGGPGQGGKPHGGIGSSQGDSALPILLVGFVAVGTGGLAYAYLRHRRSGTGPAS